MNVLITSAGQRVSLVRAFKKEVASFYPNGSVYTTDMHPELSPACRTADRCFRIVEATNDRYINELLSICEQHNIEMVVPTIDNELQVLAKHKQEFEDKKIHIIVSDSELVETCSDKRKSNELFKQLGIPYPLPVDKDNLVFPFFIKPYNGSLSADTYRISSAKEVKEEFLSDERFMFMEYLDSATYQEYTVDMYYGRDHKVKCIVPRRRIVVRAGEIRKGLTCKNVIVDYLKKHLNELKGAVGCLTLQLFMNKETNEIKATEVNPRFGGGYPLSYAAGANYPRLLIQEYCLSKELNYEDDWEDNLLMLRYDDEILVHGHKDS